VATSRIEHAARRLKAVFLEMPGTQLTVNDAARLTGLEYEICRAILAALEDARFVRQRHHGLFVQRTSESRE
jgi:hypothetical protein